MGVEIARCTAELTADLASLQLLLLLAKTVGEYHHLLAQTGWGGGLAMGLGQHRYLFPCVRIAFQLADQLVEQRVVHLLKAVFHRDGDGRVVDVLTCQTEMDEFLIAVKATETVELLLYVVFHRFHIVVCNRFNLLHAGCAAFVKFPIDFA